MGLYPDHGVEYLIILKDQQIICLVNTTQADSRLLRSNYYEKRKHAWWDDSWQTGCKPITDMTDFDIELTVVENLALSEKLEHYGEEVETHGWYDVFNICELY